ncbi:MAG: hypothetical protein Q9195_005327 [Heterodermia aff. obscurata]
MLCFTLLAGLTATVSTFPFIQDMPSVDNSMITKRSSKIELKRQANCPFNSNHPGAAPYDTRFPYLGAKNGLPGNGKGGIKVPADGDTAHAFEAPGPNDIRGPCPALNTLANHHFISHDGIATLNELLDAQQNVFNLGYDAALLFASFGISEDGDTVTEKLSIGCDATSRTSPGGTGLLGPEAGLNAHNRLEIDTSLTRQDFFLTGDDHTFDPSLFALMASTVNNLFDRDGLAYYKYLRYNQSRADNPNFYYGPKAPFFETTAAFIFEAFASYGNEGTPDLATVQSFFGTRPTSDGHFTTNSGEKVPDNWHNRRTPYTIPQLAGDVIAMYGKYPVPLGGNIGKGNFNAMGDFGTAIRGGVLSLDLQAVECFFYQLATDDVPTGLTGTLDLPVQVLRWVTGKLNPVFENYGCALKIV